MDGKKIVEILINLYAEQLGVTVTDLVVKEKEPIAC